MAATGDIVQKLWSLCHVLRDDGVTYLQYVTELTYLLFLKMMQETESEEQLPKGYRWRNLVDREGQDLMNFYRELLVHLGSKASSKQVQAIFANAQTSLTQPRILKKLVQSIDELDWFSEHRDEFGDLYEGLLQKNAEEKKSGAGQYFTPRALIDSMVALMKPKPGEVIQDPAAGTGGFLIAANRYIREKHDPFEWSIKQQEFQQKQAFCGMELVQDTHRLLLMNLMLHGIEGDVLLGNTLSSDGQQLGKADLILTNPPFGTKKGGGLPSRDDFTYPTSNKQLAFLQHIYRSLKPGGRAAVVLPDNVLFESNAGKQIRADLMDKCNLHTIIRLPPGIFYAQGVKTNVLFFTRGKSEKGNTKEVWVYDLRANMPTFGRRTQLTRTHISEFEAAFGDDPFGLPESLAKREDTGESGRFRCFSREWITERNENLDIAWLRDESNFDLDELPEASALAQEAITELEAALAELQGILDELGEEVEL
ncbi:N-6 DNA methylase [Nodosilinea sp. E11]|uniref:class I SAM-dependent DNA methyltransferase n=1 Tax=Nodosilinea sp. E11 TaxID=3037479 RepID=UPI00293502EE|nr:N-6 DNA methylase [Nodosilinea sp. E11]WOD41907.1 N-6 DNA methylase [Nodosilinea sp. E11]